MKKQTKKVLLWGIVIIFLAGFGLLIAGGKGSPQKSSLYSASALVSSESYFDFETISMDKGIVSHAFDLVNEGQDPVTIEKVYTSCMCTTAAIIDSAGKKYGAFGMPGHGGGISAADITVMPGERISVEAVFDPAAHGPSGVGLARRSVYLETNSQTSPKLELSFQAMVTR